MRWRRRLSKRPPILIGRTLYLSTPSDRVIAVDAATGQEQWVYDPQVNLKRDHSEISKPRGGGVAGGGFGRPAHFYRTIDGRLIGLDAVTGKPDPAFGVDGAVDLRAAKWG